MEQIQGAARSVRVRTVLAAIAVLATVVPLTLDTGAAQAAGRPAAPAVAKAPVTQLPGRPPGRAPVPETAAWSTQAVAPGVRVSTGTIRRSDAKPAWTVSVQRSATSRLTGAATTAEVGNQSWANSTAATLRTAGFAVRVERVDWPDYADTPHGLIGQRVRVGSYATQAAATAAAASVKAAGFRTAVLWTGYDAEKPADVQHIHVATIDPASFSGTVTGTHDGDVTQRRTPTAVAAKLGSLVGVNGGYFVMSTGDGVPGTQSALGVYDGELESMSVGARAALVLGDDGRAPRIADLTSTATARADGASYAVQGVNRLPGTVRDCGRPGATPSEHPWQDVTCHETNDLVLFTPAFGAALPTGAGVQAVLDGYGRVVSTGARGGRVPAGGSVLQGIGTAATWLTQHARTGVRVTVDEAVTDTAGKAVALGEGDSVVSAAPTLVKDGRISIDAATEGVVDPLDLSFGYAWADVRKPRTLAGIDAKGRLLLVTVDGAQKDGSEGFTIYEAAVFMRSLGAVQALNLDGGGSTAMSVDGALVTHPSDAAGERPVGDTIQVLP